MNPFDEASRKKCEDIIKETLETFGKSYPLAFVKAVVRKIKDEAGGEKKKVHLLLEPEPPAIRKEGWLQIMSKGFFKTKYKKKWFVVDSEYRITWYENEAASKKPVKEGQKRKNDGQFSAFGYRVRKNEPGLLKKLEEKAGEVKAEVTEEKKEAGPPVFEFNLVPWSDSDKTKIVYKFKCDTKEEEDGWKKTFEDCIWYSPNPMLPQEVRREAFADTYLELCKPRSWGPSSFSATGSESDMLAAFIYRRLMGEVIEPDVWPKLPDAGALRGKAMGLVETAVGKMVGPAVDAAWTAACKAIDAIAAPVEEKVKQAVQPLFEAIQKMKDRVQEKFNEKVNPVIERLSAPLTTKLLPKLFHPIAECVRKTIHELCEHKDSPRGTYHLYWDLRGKLEDFTELLSIAREILDIGELSELPDKVINTCTKLLEKAHYTFKVHKEKQVANPFERTCSEFLHDAVQEIAGIGRWLMNVLVGKPFKEQFEAIVDELCGPLEELVPEPLKEFLSPSDTVKEMGSNVVKSALEAILKSGGDQAQSLLAKFVEKGIQNVTVAEPSEEKSDK
jgi:hypothetical protein